MKHSQWLLIMVGIGVTSFSLLWPALNRNSRALAGIAGGLVLVIGLAPGRLQHQDPRHRVFAGSNRPVKA